MINYISYEVVLKGKKFGTKINLDETQFDEAYEQIKNSLKNSLPLIITSLYEPEKS